VKRALRWLAIFAGMAALLGVAGLLVVRSDWFREQVRARIIEETERASGGRAELKRFDFDWTKMQAGVAGFALHGTEAQGLAPLFRAEKITLRLTVLSWIRRRVDLSELTIEKPEFRIYVAEDGTTNLPRPRVPAKGTPVETLLKLKIGRLNLRDGLFEYDSKATPFHLAAESIGGQLDYDRAGPAYAASVSVKTLRLPHLPELGLESDARLEAQRMIIRRVRVSRGDSWVEAAGAMEGYRQPRITADWRAEAELREFPQWKLTSGRAFLDGSVRFDLDHSYDVEGRVRVAGFGFRTEKAALSGIDGSSVFRLRPGRLDAVSFSASALGGELKGEATLKDWRRITVNTEVAGLDLDRLRALVSERALPWNGMVSGPVTASATISGEGFDHAVLEGRVEIAPAVGQLPVEGSIEGKWTQDSGRIELRPSTLRTQESSLSIQGVLGERMNAGLLTRNLRNIEAALALTPAGKDLKIPVELEGGELRATAVVTGPLDNPKISGHLTATNATYSGVRFDSVATDVRVDAASLELKNLEARREGSRSTGNLRLALSDWKVTDLSAVNASATLRQADIGALLKALRIDQPVSGRADANIDVSGTLAAPQGKVRFLIRDAAYANEKFQSVQGELTYREAKPGQFEGAIQADKATIEFRGEYERRGSWRDGRLKLSAQETGLSLNASETLAAWARPPDGVVEMDVKAEIEIRGGEPHISAIDGTLNARGLTLAKKPLGDLRITAQTAGGKVRTEIAGAINGQPFRGDGAIDLSKGYPAQSKLILPRLPFAFLRDLAADPRGAETEQAPVEGFVEGEFEWSGPLNEPATGKAVATIRRIEVSPREAPIAKAQGNGGELTLRNDGPIEVTVDSKQARFKGARFKASGTDFSMGGSYTFAAKSPLDVALNGSVNLAILSNFKPDLLASGTAELDARVRGAADNPDLSGRMTMSGASFYLRDFPNGIENAQGVVHFERNRANIEKLTGQTGGGAFQVTGFVAVSRGEISYRLAATAGSVRVRYPEGVSTTLDAALTLTGSTKGSLLAGNITVQRSGFNPRTDFASAIAGSTNPIPAPITQNEFLRNLLFDIRVRTSPSATIQTTYTQDLQTEADLRLRGSPAKPVLLGAVQVNQGVINFFGNRYTVSRGEVLFYNTAAIVPSIDLDLETRIRGVTVFINVSGPLSRLNVTYRSEPPLQTNEILALLTVGRAPPTASTSAIASGGVRSPNVLETGLGGNTLLGGALSAGVNSRVERFFGASRIKIDPQLTGVDNLPQARLTIEQSLTRDVTVTYVTNLSRTQQQIVRVEWDLSKAWSLVAVRDENGVFGVDFLFRRRFK
jgi:translocation and assembly module TamB